MKLAMLQLLHRQRQMERQQQQQSATGQQQAQQPQLQHQGSRHLFAGGQAAGAGRGCCVSAGAGGAAPRAAACRGLCSARDRRPFLGRGALTAAAILCSSHPVQHSFLCVAAVCAGPMEGAGGAGAGGGLSYEAVQRLIEDRTQHLADVRMHRRACIASGVLCRVAATGRAARASWGGVQGRCHGVCEQVHERHAVCFLAAPEQDCVELGASRGTPAGTCVLATGRKFCSKARRSPRWAALTICTQT